MSRHFKRPPFVLSVVTCLTVALLVIVGSLSSKRSTALARRDDPAPMDLTLLRGTLDRVGLSPDVLAAAGVDSSGVTAVVGAVADALRSSPTALPDADAAYAAALASEQLLESSVRSGLGGSGAVTDLATARTSLASALSARDAALAGLTSTAVHALTEGQQTALATMIANRNVCPGAKGMTGACPLRALTRTPAQWAQIRHALAAERAATAAGTELDGGNAAILSSARGDTAASTAATNLGNNLTSDTSSWSSAIAGQG